MIYESQHHSLGLTHENIDKSGKEPVALSAIIQFKEHQDDPTNANCPFFGRFDTDDKLIQQQLKMTSKQLEEVIESQTDFQRCKDLGTVGKIGLWRANDRLQGDQAKLAQSAIETGFGAVDIEDLKIMAAAKKIVLPPNAKKSEIVALLAKAFGPAIEKAAAAAPVDEDAKTAPAAKTAPGKAKAAGKTDEPGDDARIV